MSDVRALLKAKRQEVRVNHPLASYSASGQLRCIICGTAIKHASAWDGHLGTKAHRMNVLRLKEEERQREEEERFREEEEAEVARVAQLGGKRKADDDEDELSDDIASKKQRVDGSETPSVPEGQNATGSFPADFFSDPSRAPPPTSDSEDDDGEGETPNAAPQSNAKDSLPESALDLEWIKFQQTVVNAPDDRETYDRATVFAEPDLVPDAPEGIPVQQSDAEPQEETPKTMSEDEKRRTKQQEERELIMDRLLDEERAQEEADTKVRVMKSRLEALKRKREAAKSKTASN